MNDINDSIHTNFKILVSFPLTSATLDPFFFHFHHIEFGNIVFIESSMAEVLAKSKSAGYKIILSIIY